MAGRKKHQSFFPTNASHIEEKMESIKHKAPPKLTATTANQKGYLRKLRQLRHDILIVEGPAGTGKTYMAVREAADKYIAGEFHKIIITRPNVATGDDLGYLPGTLNEKMAPWTRPIVDVLNECFGVIAVQQMLHREEIEIAPLAYMRGRTFKNAIIIADEMQNATADQMKMLLTRIGENSKMIVTGDTEQWDRKELGTTVSGLADITRRLKQREEAEDEEEAATLPGFITGEERLPAEPRRWERIGYYALTRADVVRHPVIEEVLYLYAA